MIPYGRQTISEADIEAVVRVLRSDFLTQGPVTPQFEAALAANSGAKHAVAVNSATSALHVACLALQVGRGDLVWTTPNTFVASANCARYCGADVDFVDIDLTTYNMSVEALEQKLVASQASGRLPKVVIPVHHSGQPCDMQAIGELATRFGFRVIEDASHAIGASYDGYRIGGCHFSDIVVFSFHPVKIVTAGEGGAALTNDPELARSMALFRSHGITRDSTCFENKDQGSWHYEQHMLGYNYRMIELEAALGLSQLDRLDEFVERRNRIARRYDHLLANLPIVRPQVKQNRTSSFHLYAVRIPQRDVARHMAVFEFMREGGIGVNLHYAPVHLQPDYRKLGFRAGQFEQSETYADTAITLPIYPGLTDEQQDLVASRLATALEQI